MTALHLVRAHLVNSCPIGSARAWQLTSNLPKVQAARNDGYAACCLRCGEGAMRNVVRRPVRRVLNYFEHSAQPIAFVFSERIGWLRLDLNIRHLLEGVINCLNVAKYSRDARASIRGKMVQTLKHGFYSGSFQLHDIVCPHFANRLTADELLLSLWLAELLRECGNRRIDGRHLRTDIRKDDDLFACSFATFGLRNRASLQRYLLRSALSKEVRSLAQAPNRDARDNGGYNTPERHNDRSKGHQERDRCYDDHPCIPPHHTSLLSRRPASIDCVQPAHSHSSLSIRNHSATDPRHG